MTIGPAPPVVYAIRPLGGATGPTGAAPGGSPHPEIGMMVTDGLPPGPEWPHLGQAGQGQVGKHQDQGAASDESRKAEEARAAADEPFDRLRAELRRSEATVKGWRDRCPWRWLAGWWRKPGDGQRP